MRSISPGLEKVSEMIASKTGASAKNLPRPMEKGKKKKKHLNFNFGKKLG